MNREFKGTKGKWIVEEGWDDVWETDTYTINTCEDSVENVEFITVWAGLDKKESEYNAQLISSAPELLSALLKAQPYIRGLANIGNAEELKKEIEQAIKKAIG